MKTRKILAMLLSLVMVIGLMTPAAMAEETTPAAMAEETTPAAMAEEPNVAKVGDTEFATLKDAIDAVADGGEIDLIANVTFNEETRTFNVDTYYDGLY